MDKDKKLKLQLKIFGFKTYDEFLSSNLWKEYKNQIKTVHECRLCRICNSKVNVDLYHISYKNLMNPQNIAIICNKCYLKQYSVDSLNKGIKARCRIGWNNGSYKNHPKYKQMV